MAASYPILSNYKYIGDSASPSSKHIDPAIMISGKTFTPPTVGSDGHFPGMNPLIYSKPDGQIFAKHITASNPHRWEVPISDFRKYGNFSPQIDDIGFGSWKAAGEQNQAREYVKLRSKSILDGYIESFNERQLKLHESDTPVKLFVHDSWYTGRSNEAGKASHLAGNLKQHLMEYYGTIGAQDLVSFLKAQGLELDEIGYLAIGFIPKGAVNAVGRANDGKVIFFGAEDSFDATAQIAKYLGLRPEDIRNFAFDEELTHIARKSYDIAKSIPEIIDEEIETKSMVRDFYLMKAKGSQGNPELARKYLKLAALKDDEVESTREVYSELWRRHEKDLESIVENEGGHVHNHAKESYSNSTYQNAASGKVVYSKFGKHDGKGADGKDAKTGSVAKSQRTAEARASPEAGAESPQGESPSEAATAEAA